MCCAARCALCCAAHNIRIICVHASCIIVAEPQSWATLHKPCLKAPLYYREQWAPRSLHTFPLRSCSDTGDDTGDAGIFTGDGGRATRGGAWAATATDVHHFECFQYSTLIGAVTVSFPGGMANCNANCACGMSSYHHWSCFQACTEIINIVNKMLELLIIIRLTCTLVFVPDLYFAM